MASIKQTVAFDPRSLSNCALWLDAADTSTLVMSGSSVSQWRDKSGSGNNSTYANLVTYSSNSINGLGVINFGPGGLNNGSMISGAISPTYTGTQVTCFIVASMKSESYIYNRFLSLGASGGNDYQTVTNIQMFGRLEGLNIGISYNNSGVSSSIPEYNSVFLAFSARNSSTLSFGVNGNTPLLGNSGTTGNFLINFYAVGASTSSQTGLSGIMCEVLIYNSALSTSQRQQVEGYLAWKWGLIANLPFAHPFKRAPIAPFSFSLIPIRPKNTALPTFDPRSINGCSLWLDSADSSTFTLSGSNVTQWRDKSTNAFIATGVVAPTYNVTTRYILFNGSSQYFTVSNGAFPTGNNPYSIFFVAFTNNSANPQWIIAGGSENTNQAIGAIFYFTNAIWHSWWGNEYRVDNSISNGVPAILNLSYSTTRTTIVNGGTATTNSPGASRNNPAGPNFIGRRVNSSEYLNGGIGEIIMFTSEIPTSQRQQVEGYLAWKWGLQGNLLSSHPYKLIQPNNFQLTAPVKTTIFRPRANATGGTRIVANSFTYHVFLTSSSLIVTTPGTINYLVVGGGGGGGDRHGGGGGAGGVLSGSFNATNGSYTITVGNGGSFGAAAEDRPGVGSPFGAGTKGGDSSISGVATAFGGGGGGTVDGNPTNVSGQVGSGGGGGGVNLPGINGTSGQGNSGGSGQNPGGGGGGGAGGAGANANTSTGGIGTAAFSVHLLAVGYGTTFATSPQSPISGGIAYIAGGGGGAADNFNARAGGLGGGGTGDLNDAVITGGTSNTGGGGGASRSQIVITAGRDGGSGLVLIWY